MREHVGRIIAFTLVLAVCLSNANASATLLWQRLGPCRAEALLPQTLDCVRIKVDPSATTGGRGVLVQLPGGDVIAPDAESDISVDGTSISTRNQPAAVATGTVRLDCNKSNCIGLIRSQNGRAFRARKSTSDGPILEQLDERKFPPEAPPVPDLSSIVSEKSLRLCGDPRAEIDVMIVYTQAAVDAAAGVSEIRRWIQQSTRQINASFQNSGVKPRIRLVHSTQVDYLERDITFDLLAFASDIDGYMDDIHKWRDSYHADLAILITGDEEAGGRSFQFQKRHEGKTSFGRRAFAVVALNAMTGSRYTLAHELGHLMGAQHDYGNTSGIEGYEQFSHGHLQPIAKPPCTPWKTIMGEQGYCYACQTRPIWSNPALSLCGVPTGEPEYEDNARTLNLTAETISRLRCAKR